MGLKWGSREQQKLIPLRPGDCVEFQDKSMTFPKEAEVVTVYKRRAAIRLSDGERRVIHRKYILRKVGAESKNGKAEEIKVHF